jgi:hypothetical protein
MNSINNSVKTLFKSIVVTDIIQALIDWNNNFHGNWILIDSVAVGYHIKPKVTKEIDILFSSRQDIPCKVTGFKRTRLCAFQHTITQIEVITSEFIKNLPNDVVQKVSETAIVSNNIKIASPSGLVTLKLHRMNRFDEDDICDLIKTGKVDLIGWPISPDKLEIYYNIVRKINN